MQPHKNNDGFTQRLTTCVDRVGGKRAMANAALISEAQLFRYLNAESDVPSDRLVSIAKAAQVDAGWLLTGTGTIEGFKVDVVPSFRPDLLRQVSQTFDELLLESDKSFTIRQRAMALTFIYEALRIEEKHKGTDIVVDKRLAPFYPDFLAPLRSDNRIEDYSDVMNQLESDKMPGVQTLRQFDTLVKMAMQSVYESAPGEIMFEKLGATLLPDASKNLLALVESCTKILGKSRLTWLDAGCGNGRHLAFLNQHCPDLILHGFDSSRLALSYCEQQVKGGKLKAGAIQEADFRALPYEAASMDVVYCRLGLQLLPYLPNQDIGAIEFMKEAARVLKPAGLAPMLVYAGTDRSYIPFSQYHTPETLAALAKQAGLEIYSMTNAEVNETGGTAGKDYSSTLSSGLNVVFRKPA